VLQQWAFCIRWRGRNQGGKCLPTSSSTFDRFDVLLRHDCCFPFLELHVARTLGCAVAALFILHEWFVRENSVISDVRSVTPLVSLFAWRIEKVSFICVLCFLSTDFHVKLNIAKLILFHSLFLLQLANFIFLHAHRKEERKRKKPQNLKLPNSRQFLQDAADKNCSR